MNCGHMFTTSEVAKQNAAKVHLDFWLALEELHDIQIIEIREMWVNFYYRKAIKCVKIKTIYASMWLSNEMNEASVSTLNSSESIWPTPLSTGVYQSEETSLEGRETMKYLFLSSSRLYIP